MTQLGAVTTGTHYGSVVSSPWLPSGGNKVSQDFGVWEFLAQFGINAPHLGIDVSGSRGDPLQLPFGLHGIVSAAGFDRYGGGNFVKLTLDDGTVVKLFHMLDVAVVTGQDLTGGTLLGHLDSTGNSTGNHVHFQVEQLGIAVDPWRWLTAIGTATTTTVTRAASGNPVVDALNNLTSTTRNVGILAGKLSSPQLWWKTGFVLVGMTFIGLGIYVYFIQEERATAVKIGNESALAIAAAA